MLVMVGFLVGCGGSTSSELFGKTTDASVDDSGSGGDSGRDGGGGGGDGGFSQCFGPNGAILAEMKRCATRADCTIEKHQTDCCGSLLYAGISRGKSSLFSLCEERWRASLPRCGCPSGPPSAEDGQTVDPQGTAKVDCVDVQGGLGVCRSQH
jgi:hypothetical protein